jgi:hypothetical protein
VNIHRPLKILLCLQRQSMIGQVRVYSQPTGKAKPLLIPSRVGHMSKITVGSELFWPRDSWLSGKKRCAMLLNREDR